MEILAVKMWQWMIAGVILGLLFSCVLFAVGPTFESQNRDTIEQGEFENAAMALTKYGIEPGYEVREIQQFHKGLPLLRDVTVHPPLADDPNHRYWVTGRIYSIGMKLVNPEKLGSLEQSVGEWKAFKYQTTAPYEPGYTIREEKNLSRGKAGYQRLRTAQLADLKNAMHGQAAFPTVVDYLKALSSLSNAQLTFKFGWWERPQFLWSLPPMSGLLIVGIAWPLTLSTLQSIGMAKAPVKKVILKPVTSTGKTPTGPQTQIVFSQTPPSPQIPEPGHKEYGGVYYPVAKTTHKEETPSTAKPK